MSASLSGLLAIELGDAGDQRAARITWGTAIRAADASGDRAMQVWVRGRAAQDAFFTGRSPQVITELANEAISRADKMPCHGLAKAHAARVYLAATQGPKARVVSALADLRRAFERLPEAQTPQSVFADRENQQAWAEAFAYVHAGDEMLGPQLP